MGKEINYFKKISSLLHKLHEAYPNISLAAHISTALADYGEMWMISDKELIFALEKYSAQLELDMDGSITDSKYIDKIIKDGMNLFVTEIDPDDIIDEEEE